MTDDVRDVTIAVERIRSILAGRPPELIGAILAELTAIWLAGHVAKGDDAATATDQLRADILKFHTKVIRKLIPVNAKMMGT